MTMENVNFCTYTESSLVICLPFCFSSPQTYSWWQRCNSTTQAAERCADPRELSPRGVPGSNGRCLPVHALSTLRILQHRRPQKAWATGYRPWKSKECRTGGHESGLEAADHRWGSLQTRPPYVCMRPTLRAAVKIQVTKHEKEKTAFKKVKCMSKRTVKIKKSDKTKDWWGYGAAGVSYTVTKTEIGKLTKRRQAWEDITNDFT